MREISHKLQRVVIAPEQLTGTEIVLSADRQHYLQRVLRLSPGARFIAMTGRGQAWLSQLGEAGTARIVTEISWQSELPVPVTAIVALPKGSGFEEIIRAGTELGASSFLPALSARTLLKPSTSKLARWQRIAMEAAEQSERECVPEIIAPIAFDAAIGLPDWQTPGIQRYICVARQDAPHLGRRVRTDGPIVMATGCEGGWTDGELEAAIAAGFVPVTLGKRILRAVTAPIAALAAISVALEG